MKTCLVSFVFGAVLIVTGVFGFVQRPTPRTTWFGELTEVLPSRDRVFKLTRKLIIGIASISILNSIDCTQVRAFENAVQVVKMPKTNGPKPVNLGLSIDKSLLRKCTKPSPNCFSTTPDLLEETEDDSDVIDSNTEFSASSVANSDVHYVPAWRYSKQDPEEAYRLIDQVLDNYEPGHDKIDGGGFKIVTRDSSKKYYYVQYESLKRGYIDDLEIAVNPDSSIQFVSSSRLGYLDLTVNAKRLNYIASKLKKLGFETSEITAKTHPLYFEANGSL